MTRAAAAAALTLGVLTLGVLAALLHPATAHAQAPEQVYQPPVDAPVTDPFRPPEVRWGPGNRGLEYGTVAGTPVRAIGPGVVSFAGPVAGTLHVTVTHPDGLRSSYSGVAAIRVAVGHRVSGGDVVAVSATGLHLGVRRGDEYIDPASLWGLVVASGPVVLVPLHDPPRALGPLTWYRYTLLRPIARWVTTDPDPPGVAHGRRAARCAALWPLVSPNRWEEGMSSCPSP